MAHPVLCISPDRAGLIYINGNIAGECDAAAPLTVPVAPQGVVYLEYHPLGAGLLPVSRRLNFVGGFIAPGSEVQSGLYIVSWPDAVIDVQILPERTDSVSGAQRLSAGDFDIYLMSGSNGPDMAKLVRGGTILTSRLPDGVCGARLMETADGRLMLLGRCSAGEFAQIYDAAAGATLLSVAGRSIAPAENGGVQVERAADDAAGHVIRELWRPSSRGYACRIVSVRREGGANMPPSDPHSAALMLGQALMLGEYAEARSLMTERAAGHFDAIKSFSGRYDACCALKYGTGGDKVGFMKLVTEGYARVYEMAYRAAKVGAGWLIDDIRPAHA